MLFDAILLVIPVKERLFFSALLSLWCKIDQSVQLM